MSFKNTLTEALSAISQYFNYADGQQPILEELLEVSKGTDSAGNTVYRPFLIAAYQIGIAPPFGGIIRAETVQRIEPFEIIKNLLSLQKSLDNGVTVPDGWDIDTWEDKLLCGCEAKNREHQFSAFVV